MGNKVAALCVTQSPNRTYVGRFHNMFDQSYTFWISSGGRLMSEPSLEERVVKLEKLLDSVLQNLDLNRRKKDWRRTAGMFDGDPLMKEIIDEGRRVRQEDRRNTGS